MATGSEDNTIRIWDIITGKELITLSGAHDKYISGVAFSPDGKQIVSSDGSGGIKVWNVSDVNEAITSMRHGNDWIRSVSFSPDETRIISAGDDNIRVWNLVAFW